MTSEPSTRAELAGVDGAGWWRMTITATAGGESRVVTAQSGPDGWTCDGLAGHWPTLADVKGALAAALADAR